MGNGSETKQRIQIFAFGPQASRNHKSFCSAKLDDVRLDGEANNSDGPASAPRAETTGHEITEGQWLSPGTGFRWRDFVIFHRATIRWKNLAALWGVHPIYKLKQWSDLCLGINKWPQKGKKHSAESRNQDSASPDFTSQLEIGN